MSAHHDHDHGAHDHDHSHDHSAHHDRAHDHGAHDHKDDHAHDHGAHDHDHAEQLRKAPVRRLTQALALTAGFMAVEVAAGVITHSLALVSDAVHMLTDAASLVLALMAQRMAARLPTPRHTYGFRRAETLAAFVNGVFLVVSSLWICAEAIARWRGPTPVQGGGMLVVASAGLVVNLVAAWLLSRGDHGHNLNTRAAMAHVLSDAAGSVAAMIAAGCILLFGWTRADAVVSLLLSVLILWGAWRLVQQTVDVLMEVVPPKVDVPSIGATIRATPGVRDFHDLHVWAVAEGFPVLTVHVLLDGTRHGAEVSRAVSDGIALAHGISHVTVQPEAPASVTWVPRDRLVRRASTPGATTLPSRGE